MIEIEKGIPIQHGYPSRLGLSRHKLYPVWKNMRSRCNNPRSKNYKYWGGRGIRICPQWADFWVFVVDMGPRPAGYMIDRKDNDKGYEPDNCRWVTHRDSALNRRNSKKPKPPM